MPFPIVNQETNMDMSVTNLTSWQYICTSLLVAGVPLACPPPPARREERSFVCAQRTLLHENCHMLDFQMYFCYPPDVNCLHLYLNACLWQNQRLNLIFSLFVPVPALACHRLTWCTVKEKSVEILNLKCWFYPKETLCHFMQVIGFSLPTFWLVKTGKHRCKYNNNGCVPLSHVSEWARTIKEPWSWLS